MSWIDQGRQEHGWFGHGTSAAGRELRQRAFVVPEWAGEHLPAGHRPLLERTRDFLRQHAPSMAPLSHLRPSAFRERFFRDGTDPVDAWHVQQLMRDLRDADDHPALKQAGHDLADMIHDYGPRDWSSLLGRLGDHVKPEPGARENLVHPAQFSPAMPGLLPPPPVMPGSPEVERGFVKPLLKAGRELVDALDNIFRHDKPEEPEPTEPDPSQDATRTGKTVLPKDPDDLLRQGWKEISRPAAAAKGHRTFENPETGEIVRHDKGKLDKPGFKGKDHYHRFNPSGTNKHDQYLDKDGNPVGTYNDRSHLLPGG